MKENVWDYPRGAMCRQFSGVVTVIVGVAVLAKSSSVFRTLETSHPTTYYPPGNDVNFQRLVKMTDQPCASGKREPVILITSPLKT